MEEKSYSDRRWWDNPMPVSSLCDKCIHWKGFGKCEKFKDKVPREILEKSFPGTRNFDEGYCKNRKQKDSNDVQ